VGEIAGAAAKDGDEIKVHYKGALSDGNTVFDEGELHFPLGRGHVIRGWDVGLVGIKVEPRASLRFK